MASVTGGLLDDMLMRHGEPLDEDEDDNGRSVCCCLCRRGAQTSEVKMKELELHQVGGACVGREQLVGTSK